jgi:hypothetical protein
MSEFAPVAVKEPACRCSRCLGAFRIVLAAQQLPPPIVPYPQRQRRRNPRALAEQIWAEEVGKEAP